MVSLALLTWRTDRAARIENLISAHLAVTGGTRGRKYNIEEINHALIVRLASEFQGFCRDLHDECIESVLLSADLKITLEPVVRVYMKRSRKLDSQNASWGNICGDFSPLGVSLADEMKARYPKRYPRYYETLDRLNKARNAIAHQDAQNLAKCRAEQALTLATCREWRSKLNGIAAGLDAVLHAYLTSLNGQQPWARGG